MIIKEVVATVIGTIVAGIAITATAGSVTVTDITDWGTTPMEIVDANLPYLGYSGGVYAGINTLLVTDGASSTTYSGFCIDPFHWSATGPSSPYNFVPLVDAPKSPATLNAATALNIENLWAEFYSPTMTSSNAVANDGLPAHDAFSLVGPNNYGASQDLASLATYDGPAANLMALTGPGQDYVVDPVPDAGATFIMLALALGALVLARPSLIKSAGQPGQAIPAHRRV